METSDDLASWDRKGKALGLFAMSHMDYEVELLNIHCVRDAVIKNGNTNTMKKALNEEQVGKSNHESDIRNPTIFNIILRNNVEIKQ